MPHPRVFQTFQAWQLHQHLSSRFQSLLVLSVDKSSLMSTLAQPGAFPSHPIPSQPSFPGSRAPAPPCRSGMRRMLECIMVLNNSSVTQEQPRFSTSSSELSEEQLQCRGSFSGIQTFLLCPTVRLLPRELDGLGGVCVQNSLNLRGKNGINDG